LAPARHDVDQGRRLSFTTKTAAIGSMSRVLASFLMIAVALAVTPAASAAPTHKKKHITKHWHGYGFLPGYRPPEAIERARARAYWRSGPHYYGPAWPGFYRGRWNGGGFGPCYVSTPIGYMWTCGQ
jgi:hypothetical protein